MFFLVGDYEVYGQPAAVKEISNYRSAFVICAGIKGKRGVLSALPRFQCIFSKLFKICEQSSVRDSSEKASLSVSVIKICSVWETSCCKSQIN